MSKAWPQVPLGEVASVEAGNPAPQEPAAFSSGGTPFVRMQDVGRLGRTTSLTETKDRLTKSAAAHLKLFPAGSILVPKSGASIRLNHRAILGIDAYVVSHLAVIRPSNQIDGRFAYYWLCTQDLGAVAHDADMPSLKTSELACLMVPLPALSDQRRIVAILDAANELRRLRAEADGRTTDLIPALFNEMFGDPIQNVRAWTIKPVSAFVGELQGGKSMASAGEDDSGGQYRVLKISAVTWGEFRPDENKPVPAGYTPPQTHFVRPGDLLFSRANTTALVGATSYVFETPPNLLLPDKLWRFAWSEPLTVEPLFVWWLFQTPTMREKLGKLATGTGGAMKNISKAKVMALRVPVPPLPLQKQFADKAGGIRRMQWAQAQSRQRLDDLFQSLLHRAFQGQL